jgi:hypothetical protein
MGRVRRHGRKSLQLSKSRRGSRRTTTRGRTSGGRGSRSEAGRRGWVGALSVLLGILLSAPWIACFTSPPKEPDDLCAIFSEKRSWYRSAERSYDRWGVPAAVQLAIIHQESSFRATARPPRRRFLWVFPGSRPSSAYGYGQVIDETWRRYVKRTGHHGADRDDFGDVSDFIGWYGDHIHRQTGIQKHEAGKLYMAYHEGPAGFKRGTHDRKGWLQRVARKVDRRAASYQGQYDVCREKLAKRSFFWPF